MNAKQKFARNYSRVKLPAAPAAPAPTPAPETITVMLYTPNGAFLARFKAPTWEDAQRMARDMLNAMGRVRGSIKVVD